VRYRRVWGSAPAGSFPLISLILHGCAKGQPSKRWPNAVNGRTRSQMIFVIASIGTDNIAPGTPHIQNQKTRDTITRTACSLKARRAETKARRLFCQLRKDGNRAAAKYAPPAEPGGCRMFVIFTVGGALVGALLGLRFKVLALIPGILIAACAIIATGDSLKAIALTIFATAVLLQVGYALGLVVRVLAAQRLSPRSIPREPSSKSRRVGTLSRSENQLPLNHSWFDSV
jgi:hypothetical protein